jgi:exonuclease III
MISILTYNIHGLPWSFDHTLPIARWSGQCGADLLCFQEVFTTPRKITLQHILEEHGYHVFFPIDIINDMLPSGLCIALKTTSLWSHRSTRFTPFFNYTYGDIFANKGFFKITLQHITGICIHVINTHMQSDVDISYFRGSSQTNTVRRKQLQEIITEYTPSKDAFLIVGDLNQDGSIHPSVNNLCCKHGDALSTFPSTGENLDHMAWIVGTGVTPLLQSIQIRTDISFSDHSPVLCRFKLQRA